jgi:hypothetical protein
MASARSRTSRSMSFVVRRNREIGATHGVRTSRLTRVSLIVSARLQQTKNGFRAAPIVYGARLLN